MLILQAGMCPEMLQAREIRSFTCEKVRYFSVNGLIASGNSPNVADSIALVDRSRFLTYQNLQAVEDEITGFRLFRKALGRKPW